MCAILATLFCAFLTSTPAVAQTNSSYCDRFMEDYARSSARKLRRALSGQSYALNSIALPDTYKFEPREQTFTIYSEENAMAAAMIETTRQWRITYAMVMSEIGPIIASHTWPARDAVTSGSKPCDPISSAIEAPILPSSEIDIEPFRYWGLRVVWRLPRAKPENANNDLLETFQAVLEKAHGISAEPSRSAPRPKRNNEGPEKSGTKDSPPPSDAALITSNDAKTSGDD